MTQPHLCHIHPAFGTGGPEVRTSLVIDASGDAFRHTVIALNGNLGGRTRIRRQEAVCFLEPPRVGGVRGLAKLLRDLRPDLVLTHGWGGSDALLAARMVGIRRVIHAEDGFLPDEAARQRFPRLVARRILLRIPRRVVCPSQTLVRIANRMWWLPTHKICYIPNGVDAAGFSSGSPEVVTAARRHLGCMNGEVIVGTVGRLGAEKNHARLIRAFATVAARRPARLAIVGDGPERESLARLARNLGLADRVIFTGQTDRPVDYYRAMDIFALSSDTEQMPIALLEAMAVGLPIVSTDVGDVREMVATGNRVHVIPPEQEDAYASALDALADAPHARVRLGQENREKCRQQHTLDTMVQAYLNLYREILEIRRR
jgi:glycosyltransferase involved in cell wall biosynthesis